MSPCVEGCNVGGSCCGGDSLPPLVQLPATLSNTPTGRCNESWHSHQERGQVVQASITSGSVPKFQLFQAVPKTAPGADRIHAWSLHGQQASLGVLGSVPSGYATET